MVTVTDISTVRSSACVLLDNGDELEVALDADYAVVSSVLDPRD